MEVENEISYKIRGAIFTVYNNLGPGLLESAYEVALRIELEKPSQNQFTEERIICNKLPYLRNLLNLRNLR